MQCPRLTHFVRLNSNSSMGRCGHMIDAKTFESLDEMENSNWLNDIKEKFSNNEWPHECKRCEEAEKIGQESIRLYSMKMHNIQKTQDYLIIGGVLDNICNSACQTCDENLSTKIGSLTSSNYKKVNNYTLFNSLPLDRIVHLDINGGEPSTSPNYKKLLNNLPINVKSIRINTNGSTYIAGLEKLLQDSKHITITLSLDGTDKIHDYIRWPVKWDSYTSVMEKYISLRDQYTNLNINFWTTLSVLNIRSFQDILLYSEQIGIPLSYSMLHTPSQLSCAYDNVWNAEAKHKFEMSESEVLNNLALNIGNRKNNTHELNAYLQNNDKIRNIDHRDYII